MKNMLLNKPEFFLITKANCARFIIEINGYEIRRKMSSDGDISFEYPLNSYMKSGGNLLSLSAYPDEKGEAFNSATSITLELGIRSAEPTDESEDYAIGTINFFASQIANNSGCESSSEEGFFDSNRSFEREEKGDVEVFPVRSRASDEFEGGLIFEREFNIPSSIPLWSFFNSDELPNYDDWDDAKYYAERDAIFETVYKPLYDLFKAEDVDGILAFCSERNNEMDQALYLAPGTYDARLRNSLKDTFDKERFELADLEASYLQIYREQNGKIAQLERGRGESAIGYNLVGGGGSVGYPFLLRRQDGKWFITR